MKKFTDKQIADLMQQTKGIMEDIAEGKSTRDIMAQIYVENLEDKTEAQGLAVADKILETVKKFDEDYAYAREDIDGFINRFQDKAEEGMSVCERCNYWLKIASAVTAAGEELANGTLDREKIMERIEKLEISEEEATEEKAEKLRKQAFEALKNSGIMIVGLKDLEAGLEDMSNADEAAGLLIDLGNREVEYRAIMSMLAYTKVKTGEFDDIPIEMTAPQITTAVCAGVEEIRIAEGVENGSILVDVAAALLAILGVLVLVDVFSFIFITGATVLNLVFPTILAIPACIMLGFGLFRLGATCFDQWRKDSVTIVSAVIKGASLVLSGVKAVASFVINKVVPTVVSMCKKLWARLTNRPATTEESEVEHEKETESEAETEEDDEFFDTDKSFAF